MKRMMLAAAAAAALMTTPAAAATVIYSYDVASAAVPTTTNFSFAQFDSSLGTLTSVNLAFTADLTASGTAYNNSAASHGYQLTATNAKAGVTGNGFDLSAVLASGSFNLGTVGGNKPIPLGAYTGSGSDTDSLASGLAAFIGSGNLNFSFTRSGAFSLSNPSKGTLTPAMGGKVTLTYNYDAPVITPPVSTPTGAVPEPATWAMMLMGFASLGAMVRKRRQSAAFAI